MGMIEEQYREHFIKGLEKVEIKDIKKGDIFYERYHRKLYKYIALEDAQDKGNIIIAKEPYKQYQILILNEHKEERYMLVTPDLSHYNNRYYK